MAVFNTKQIRNVALLGHGSSGKTSLAEAMLYLAKCSDRLGKTGDGNTVSDFDPEEIKRKFSIYSSLMNAEWNGGKINILDTPGFLDFNGEVLSALRVADSAIIMVDAKSGVEVGTELAWDNATKAKLPVAFFINKCDDPEARFSKNLDDLADTFGKSVCPVIIPASHSGAFINLIDMKKYVFDDKGNRTEGEINPEYMPKVEKYREKLFEAIAATDEALMEKFFEGEEITKEEASLALHEGIISGEITPVFSGSATRLWGVRVCMDVIMDSYPRHTAKKVEHIIEDGEVKDIAIDPEGDPAIFVYKTTIDQFGRTTYFKVMQGTLNAGVSLRNIKTGAVEKFARFSTVRGKKLTDVDTLCCGDIGAVTKLTNTNTGDTLVLNKDMEYVPTEYPEPFYTMAVLPKAKGEEDKIAQGISKILDEDKTLRFTNNAETKQLLISGMGDMQIDVVLSKMKARNGISVDLAAPKIEYRETIKKKVQCEGKHKKQSGGHGQYGHVKITFSPGSEEGLTFTTSVVGGSVPKNYFPAVEKGLQEAMQKGVLAGYPVVNLAADLFDGSYHDVDSNELSFKMAASLAYKAGLPLASPVLLEPVGMLKVSVPEAMVGDVMGDINSKRRGSVMGMNPSEEKKGYTVIEAEVPKAEMVDYSIALRAMTQGRGTYTFYFERYAEVPGNIAQKIIAEAKNAEE